MLEGRNAVPAIGERVTNDPPRPRPWWARLRCWLGKHPSTYMQSGWATFEVCNDCMTRVA